MAQKTQEKGLTGPAPVVDEPGRVRNVVLVGHSGAGKTTLVEALLAATGTISRAGSVTEGTTVGDNVMPLYLPLHGDDGTSIDGLIGLISQRVFDYSTGYPPDSREPEPQHVSGIEEARNELLEGIIAESEDETLMDRYLSGEEID